LAFGKLYKVWYTECMFPNTAKQRVRNHLYSLLALFIVGLFVFGMVFIQGAEEEAQAADNQATIQQIHTLVNQQREAENLPPLEWNQQLSDSAQDKAIDMVEKSYFAHVSPVDGKKWSTFILESEYDYNEAGENLAVGFTDPHDIVQAWMDSPSHRENILADGFEESGLGLYIGEWKGRNTYFIAHHFGRQ